MMSPEPLYFPLGYVTRHAFKTGNRIVVLWLEAFPNHASYLVDINVFRRKLHGNFEKICGTTIVLGTFTQHKSLQG